MNQCTWSKLHFNLNARHEIQTVNKCMFLSEDTDVFVISPNKQTFHFPEIENLKFGD